MTWFLIASQLRNIIREEIERAFRKVFDDEVDVYPLFDEKVQSNGGSKADTSKEGGF